MFAAAAASAAETVCEASVQGAENGMAAAVRCGGAVWDAVW